LRSALANSSQDPISKITKAKWTGGVAQAVESLLCKHEALQFNKKKVLNLNGGNSPTTLNILKTTEMYPCTHLRGSLLR
jgi:hypothetical protein